MNEGSGTYWSTTNSSGYTSALSYIPEMAWNESGAAPSCPSGDSCSGLWATGGGVSTVYSKPSWQVAPGVPSDGQRDCPDISLAAAAGHDGAIVYLEDGTNNGLSVIGGTSWSSRSWAGVMALVVQKMGGQGQGNANPRLYQLGNEQYTSGSPVVFHDVTSGNNSVPNVTGYSCTTGYDLATGLGSVDVNALVNHWAACTTPGTPSGLAAGVPGNNEINLSWTAGSPAGSTYNVYRAVGSCPGSGYALLAGGVTSTTYKDLTVSGGTTYSYEVTAVDNTGGCESAKSACASAAATGACTLPPTFAGLSSVSSPGNTSCELDLSWPAATANCGKSVYYNVYRSTSASFNPSASNMVATGITATSYADTNNLASGTPYYYIVRAVDSGNGSEDTNSVEKTGISTGATTTIIGETFEEGATPTSGGTWTHSAGQGTDNWARSTAGNPHSPTHTFFAADVATVNDDYLVTPSFTVPANATLSFWQTYALESTYDGAVIEISTDGGSTWNDLGSDITQGGYNSTISSNWGSPIAGRQAWSGGSIGTETQVMVDLSSFSGQAAQIRFRLACDSSNGDTGWYIDDVVLSGYVSCATVTGVRPVPDGKWISGTPMKATRSDSGGRTIGLTWDVSTCQDPNYNVYYGNGSAVSTYTLTGSACAIGNSGSATWSAPAIPSGQKFIWWVIVGTDGVSTESSWGNDSSGTQRHPAASGECGMTAKSTATSCP
ncbi:MAG: choice-of-anchor J domain-containing protein, partial [Acidobacteriota bacterium]